MYRSTQILENAENKQTLPSNEDPDQTLENAAPDPGLLLQPGHMYFKI